MTRWNTPCFLLSWKAWGKCGVLNVVARTAWGKGGVLNVVARTAWGKEPIVVARTA